MYRSLLGGFLQDANKWMTENIGPIGMPLLIAILAVITLALLSNIIVTMAKVTKPKLTIKWGQLALLIIFGGLLIWLCITYAAK